MLGDNWAQQSFHAIGLGVKVAKLGAGKTGQVDGFAHVAVMVQTAFVLVLVRLAMAV